MKAVSLACLAELITDDAQQKTVDLRSAAFQFLVLNFVSFTARNAPRPTGHFSSYQSKSVSNPNHSQPRTPDLFLLSSCQVY